MWVAHRQPDRIAGGGEFGGAIEHEVEPSLEDVEILVLGRMDVRRHESAGRTSRVPRGAVRAAGFRHIGLAEDVPANALDAFIGAGDAGDFVFHCYVSS